MLGSMMPLGALLDGTSMPISATLATCGGSTAAPEACPTSWMLEFH